MDHKPQLGVLIALIALALSILPPDSFAGNKVNGKKPAIAPTKLTLAQAVSIALTRNLRLADSRLSIAEKEHQRREAYSDFFPTVDVQYAGSGYRYRQGSIVSALGASGRPQVNLGNIRRVNAYRVFTMAATVTQPLFTGGRLLSDYKFARLGVDYSSIQMGVDRQDLTLDVYEAYYQLTQAQKLLEVANASIRALQALRNQTSEFYKAGVVPKVDVLSTEGQLAQAYIQQTQALTDIERYKATLNYLLRYPQETDIDIIQDFNYRPNSYRLPDIYAIAAGNRLEIRQANISVEQALALVKSSKADILPNVSVQTQGSRINDDWNVFDPEANNDWRITGILTWTFDMFRKRETVKERTASQARAFVAREQLVEQIMEEVKFSYIDMKRSEADIQNNKKAVEFRQENFRINQERYKEQVATYIEVLDAQRQLSLAQGDYVISLIGYMINRAILERRLGIIR